MATVYVGKRWEPDLGNYSFHCGTLAYLKKRSASHDPGTAKYVHDEDLGPDGQYDHC
jgi:hypothetical protein